MAVCGNPDSRHGIILAKNELAKAYGIETAETVWQARRKCRELVLVPPHHERYKSYSDKINEIYQRFTDRVEPFSIDESWLDVTGSLHLFGNGMEIANCIRKTVCEELGLTLSAGVSFNKIFSKMGSDYKKPDATTVISRENYKKIVWPLPIDQLFFVGRVTAEKLIGRGITTIGELALSNRKLICSLLGKHGAQIHDYANGLENSPVARFCERQMIKSVGNAITFRRNLAGRGDIKTAVTALADMVSSRLRENEMKCWGVKVDIKDPYFNTISRQKQLCVATNLGNEIAKATWELIEKSWNLSDSIRLISITGIHLTNEMEEEQISLFEQQNQNRKKQENVERAMDAIRKKYGGRAITFGGVINNDIGIECKEEEENEFM